MSLAGDILTALDEGHANFVHLRGEIRRLNKASGFGAEISNNSLSVTLSRLKKRGLVKNENGIWNITARGLNRLRIKPPHSLKLANSRPKNMIVVFDIPEVKKAARVWLRTELAALGFTMLQKSVWFGPAPLPPKLIKTLQDLGILNCLKFFKAEESDIV